jgi:hypothetical protein
MDQSEPAPLDLRRNTYLIEIEAKVLVRSSRDPEQLCADICSRISEHVGRDEDILDLGVEAYTLHDGSCGSSD